MLNNLFIQSVAIIALGAITWSFQQKERKLILRWQIAGLLIWAIHFILLSAWTGAGLMLMNAVITGFFAYKNKYHWINNLYFLIFSCLSLLIVTGLTWGGFYSLFALLAITSVTLARWQNIPKMIRIVSIPASIFWIIYDIYVHSWGGIVAELVILAAITIALVRAKDSGESIVSP